MGQQESKSSLDSESTIHNDSEPLQLKNTSHHHHGRSTTSRNFFSSLPESSSSSDMDTITTSMGGGTPEINDQIVVANFALLGTGGSGKSTLFKTLSLPFPNHKKTVNPLTMYLEQVIHSFGALYDLKDVLLPNVKYFQKENEIFMSYFKDYEPQLLSGGVNELRNVWMNFRVADGLEFSKKIVKLWNEEPILQICYYFTNFPYKYIPPSQAPPFKYSRNLQICNLSLYINSLGTLIHNYVNNVNCDMTDLILTAYMKTTGITEIKVDLNDGMYREAIVVYDTGGQRNERRKWKHILDDSPQNNISGIIYLVSLAEFTEVCYEDQITNRTLESLNLFSQYVNEEKLRSIPFYLIFTKRKLFDFKLRMFDLSSVPFENRESLETLKLYSVLNREYREELFNTILKISPRDLELLTLTEIELLEKLCSNPNYSPSQLIEMLRTDSVPDANTNPEREEQQQEYVARNIQFLTQQFFNTIQSSERFHQVVRDHKILDLSDIEKTKKTVHEIFNNFSPANKM
ncbi:hypothetical protein C9374_011781 [Naegleria lovaniensis]|uniref:Uncharacterized protein n=1 Tax=Naegleria lovaniensis TaxID=51637 RepID=A0AA88KF98_NAELO|nr:uncharacterized protein C9374_014750 [Naegleria lovaniensis]XP_044543070.1 uncharacterized protein C9374_011781 [Naegleria lovaniensis]KAG2370611.1 hypothetical protein C9374_014750 [Naegleria lovaniensis]KAG2373896.1 hypothetical protein C9374_011781 [Naegleria lovaniensis]